MEDIIFYNIINTPYRSNASVVIDKGCNGITVVNTGAVSMTVNSIPLAPPAAPQLLGESVSFGGNRNEIFLGRIDIAFSAGVGSCIVTQKIYFRTSEHKPY